MGACAPQGLGRPFCSACAGRPAPVWGTMDEAFLRFSTRKSATPGAWARGAEASLWKSASCVKTKSCSREGPPSPDLPSRQSSAIQRTSLAQAVLASPSRPAEGSSSTAAVGLAMPSRSRPLRARWQK